MACEPPRWLCHLGPSRANLIRTEPSRPLESQLGDICLWRRTSGCLRDSNAATGNRARSAGPCLIEGCGCVGHSFVGRVAVFFRPCCNENRASLSLVGGGSVPPVFLTVARFCQVVVRFPVCCIAARQRVSGEDRESAVTRLGLVAISRNARTRCWISV